MIEQLRELVREMRAPATVFLGEPAASVIAKWASRLESLLPAQPAAGEAVRKVRSALLEVETYLEEREDVIDGDYGAPEPNKEMSLLREVREAIAIVNNGVKA